MRQMIGLLVILMIAWMAAAEDGFKVIAHGSVPVTSISAKDLSALFLKKTVSWAKWGSSVPVVPVDLSASSDVREAFSRNVHGRAAAAVKAYWQQQIFSGRGAPPPELSSDAEVIAAVAKTAGGIGYVSSGAAIPDGIKQLRITN